MVDRIENHVTGTQEYVAKAQVQLKEAEVLQTKARKVLFLATQINKQTKFLIMLC